MLSRTLSILAFCLLAGCASPPPLPAADPALQLPSQLHLQRSDARGVEDSVLVIQREGDALRWSQLDLIGMPLARQLLRGHTWQADGFLAPNPAARELFAALLFALQPQGTLAAQYPSAESGAQWRRLGKRWAVHYQLPQAFTLDLGEGLSYHVSPLPSETPAP